ncbi:MAG: hypothetical protein JGK17_05575 [Microcoleus sp. PH2017_10_PVI_O_A]|uniref:hypothetical protein n=1 Tax=unclassified Microcoleus TaxID=2642155 RepID=UPI001D8A7320|nr:MULTISPECIES: hypothetical protein [unclassified Microcoleus]TAE85616.1 MAG: hypothetical protein EAZ83_01720 [Oscillatoriales cyanobacterium]MCC3405056.1 hypothetical protein [Microcoleus sp. PH2017_10_PVI_O_A]MCC3459137.1 hypothetical protein [Microcoleus sp. PH2017_11_PCY_U_A]MCC3477194.1 hypothetical protein [Microcoleus sp. PH2017_12_PCY_D_A]MCC3530749.1 hypothetical protein [Microcoleus sp. PH2017_21_RUC_O_A]
MFFGGDNYFWLKLVNEDSYFFLLLWCLVHSQPAQPQNLLNFNFRTRLLNLPNVCNILAIDFKDCS